MSDTRVEGIWLGIKARCNPKSTPHHRKDHADKGISLCERWQSFENFYADMGDPPTDSHSIDRIDNDGNYEPSNCRWATPKEQCRNKRNNKMITINGETKCLAEWCELKGLNYNNVQCRIKGGWSIERALGTPTRNKEFRVR